MNAFEALLNQATPFVFLPLPLLLLLLVLAFEITWTPYFFCIYLTDLVENSLSHTVRLESRTLLGSITEVWVRESSLIDVQGKVLARMYMLCINVLLVASTLLYHTWIRICIYACVYVCCKCARQVAGVEATATRIAFCRRLQHGAGHAPVTLGRGNVGEITRVGEYHTILLCSRGPPSMFCTSTRESPAVSGASPASTLRLYNCKYTYTIRASVCVTIGTRECTILGILFYSRSIANAGLRVHHASYSKTEDNAGHHGNNYVMQGGINVSLKSFMCN